jgi:mRNA-degrading endonuclease YafQ of YafQ-DinJ toxin-antitoxin module
MSTENIAWNVGITNRAQKGKDSLPPEILFAFMALFKALQQDGPMQPRRRNFGKIEGKKDTWHCHLNSGRPTYVVVWKVLNKQAKSMEIQYVGTHENAPY